MSTKIKILLTCLFINALLLSSSCAFSQEEEDFIHTVLGPVPIHDLGITLMHEHVMADFIGADKTGSHRYDSSKVFTKMLPGLLELKKMGCNTFVDCTPAYFGRDVRILKRLAEKSGLHIITNTGYYGALKENFLPPHAYAENAEQLAERWIREYKNGIDGTGVKPGFIKVSVDEGRLRPVYVKLLTAAAITHKQTGLSISAHTGNGIAALHEIAVLKEHGVHPSAFRWVHAQNEKDKTIYLTAARLGAWVEFDGIDSLAKTIREHVEMVKFMKDNKLLNRTLISQDAGWYWVGEPDGGPYRSYIDIFEKFIPALTEAGFTDTEIKQLLVDNPRESLMIRKR
jgi:predicted metal-dependent phosphotriesterase family hydrolase